MANEKRLIDAYALKRAIRMESWKQETQIQLALDYIDIIIDEQTKVDAVEVVRCEDCVHDNTTACPLCFIEKHTLQFINHDAEFFCGKGERKECNAE